jgi:hypothetical protein
MKEQNPNLSGPEVEDDEQVEESSHGQPNGERENDVEICGSGDFGEATEASPSECRAAAGNDDESQYRACPFCAKAVLSSHYDKHVGKHQPITRAIN